jgi:hypothetical protein
VSLSPAEARPSASADLGARSTHGARVEPTSASQELLSAPFVALLITNVAFSFSFSHFEDERVLSFAASVESLFPFRPPALTT